MMAINHGHIFNICSIASLNAYANGGSYSISKFALLGFSKNLREELKPHGIKVTAVCPGATMSGSWDGVDIDPKRIMEANDVAKMIFHCCTLIAHGRCRRYYYAAATGRPLRILKSGILKF